MNLLNLQRGMRDALLADDDPTGPLVPGMQVYRNAYRNRLLDALKTSFERTLCWVGKASFEAAARHHIILNPPTSWTLDAYGADFDQTLAELFAQDPEVAELAWLEWQMSCAFAAPDCAAMEPAALLSGPLADGDWDAVRISLVTSFAARLVHTECLALWLALRDNAPPQGTPILSQPAYLVVWRRDLAPHFRQFEANEFAVLHALSDGETFGAVCSGLAETAEPEAAVQQIGTWLGQWLQDGLIAEIRSA